MFTCSIENDRGETLQLTNNRYYNLISIEGLLSPLVEISSITATNRDGSIPTNIRATDRTITISIAPRSQVEDSRQRLYRFFPIKKEVTLYFKNQKRDLKINGIVEAIDGLLFELNQTLEIVIRCYNPFFKNRYESNIELSQVVANFEFPFAIEAEGMEFSYVDRQLSQIIENSGEIETGLIIGLEAMGTVVNPIIYNADSRASFGLNFTMQEGDKIIIDTNVGDKKVELVRNGEISNIINSIEKNNTWLNLPTGNTVFTYSCDSGAENLYINFNYYLMFAGV